MSENNENFPLNKIFKVLKKYNLNDEDRQNLDKYYQELNDRLFTNYQYALKDIGKVKKQLLVDIEPEIDYEYISEKSLRILLYNDFIYMKRAKGIPYGQKKFEEFCCQAAKQIEGIIYFFFFEWSKVDVLFETNFHDFTKEFLKDDLLKSNKKSENEKNQEWYEIDKRNHFDISELSGSFLILIKAFRYFHFNKKKKGTWPFINFKILQMCRIIRNNFLHRSGTLDFEHLDGDIKVFLEKEDFHLVESSLFGLNREVRTIFG